MGHHYKKHFVTSCPVLLKLYFRSLRQKQPFGTHQSFSELSPVLLVAVQSVYYFGKFFWRTIHTIYRYTGERLLLRGMFFLIVFAGNRTNLNFVPQWHLIWGASTPPQTPVPRKCHCRTSHSIKTPNCDGVIITVLIHDTMEGLSSAQNEWC